MQTHHRLKVSQRYSRDEIIGVPTYWKVGTFGVAQFEQNYDRELLARILEKALALKDSLAFKRHLNLKFIRAAHRYIPEINDLVFDTRRLHQLAELTGIDLEPYPVSVVSSTVTFMGPQEADGTIGWHADGVPVTELIPLLVDDVEGGNLELYRGLAETGLALIESGQEIPYEDRLSFRHKVGYSTVGQLLRILHRTEPIRRGYRVTLNLNLRSRSKPYIDDNSLVYLGADNPEEDWHAEYMTDIRSRQLPAYRAAMQVA